MTDSWDQALRAAMAPARDMEPTEAEVGRVLAIDRARTARRRTRASRLVIAACAVGVLGIGTYAVPPTRAAVDDVYSSITGWFSSDEPGAAPGRPLTASVDVPAWVSEARGVKRLIAENAGATLYVVRRGDQLEIALGDSVGLAASVEEWRERFAAKKLVLLGPGGFGRRPIDDHFRRPFMGLTARSVKRVELRYLTGEPSTQENLSGGFVVLADARRRPQTLVAYDASGREVERVDVSHFELRFCTDVRGCPPGRLTLTLPKQG